MDFSSLFPSTDNLFKFLFLGGLIMVFTAMIYPLQKKQEKELEIIVQNQQVELINKDIKDSRANIKALSIEVKQTIKVLESLTKDKAKTKNKALKQSITNQIALIKKSVNESADSIRKKQKEIDTKVIVIKYNSERISMLDKYVKTYNSYSCWLLWFGVPLSAFGLIFWSISTYKTEKLKSKELQRP